MKLVTKLGNKKVSIPNDDILREFELFETHQLLNYFFREIKFDLYNFNYKDNDIPITIRKHRGMFNIEIHVDEGSKMVYIYAKNQLDTILVYTNDMDNPFKINDTYYNYENGFNFILNKIREIWL